MTAYLTVERESDIDLIQSYAINQGISIKISKTIDLEDEIFGNLMLEEETNETVSLYDFLELVDSEN